MRISLGLNARTIRSRYCFTGLRNLGSRLGGRRYEPEHLDKWNSASDLPPLKQARRAILWKIVANALGIIIGLVLMEGVLEFLDKPKLPISGWRSTHHRLEL